jgi:hypothetical protein
MAFLGQMLNELLDFLLHQKDLFYIFRAMDFCRIKRFVRLCAEFVV